MPSEEEILDAIREIENEPVRKWRPLWCWLLTGHRIETTDFGMIDGVVQNMAFAGSCRCGKHTDVARFPIGLPTGDKED